MKKFVSKLLVIILNILLVVLIMLLLMVSFFTPEKTKHGTYTNAIKYWTSDSYMCENFDCPVQKKGK